MNQDLTQTEIVFLEKVLIDQMDIIESLIWQNQARIKAIKSDRQIILSSKKIEDQSLIDTKANIDSYKKIIAKDTEQLKVGESILSKLRLSGTCKGGRG
jgi:hypothetical protein